MLTEYSMKGGGTQVFGPAAGAMNYMEDGIEGTARFPGKILPIELSEYGGNLLCQKGEQGILKQFFGGR